MAADTSPPASPFSFGTGKPRRYCHACRKEVELEGKPGRRDECPHCAAELHVCLNCELYDPRIRRGCREPQADEVPDVARGNFCSWFVWKDGLPAGGPSDTEKSKAAFEAMFKK